MGRLGIRAGWLARCIWIAAVVGIAIVSAGFALQTTQRAAAQHAFADDFETSVWKPGRALLGGESPLRDYSLDGHEGGTVYPPIATVATLPFSLPPYQLARLLWLATLVGALLLSLRLCGVRDWRCYAAACACPPVVAGILYANFSLLLVLPAALAWRWRDRPWVVGPLLGLVIAAKVFLWPLALWLAITRRSRAFALTLASGALLSAAGWAIVGFDQIGTYSDMMRQHAEANDQDGVSVAALVEHLGLPGNELVALAAGLAALAIAVRARRNDLGVFAWAVTAALLASPMVWWHYYALLLVPLALSAPVWSRMWLVPFALFPWIADMVVGIAASVLVASHASRARVPAESPPTTDPPPSRARPPRLRPAIGIPGRP